MKREYLTKLETWNPVVWLYRLVVSYFYRRALRRACREWNEEPR